MPSRSTESFAVREAKYLAALQHLVLMRDESSEDKGRRREEIGLRAVARKAKLSHSPLSRGKFPKVTAAIANESTLISRTNGHAAEIKKLKQNLGAALDAKRKLATHVAHLLLRIAQLEQKLARRTEKT